MGKDTSKGAFIMYLVGAGYGGFEGGRGAQCFVSTEGL